MIPESSVPVPPKPTDAQLVALMQQNRERLMLPERRKLTIVRFSAKALAPTLTVDPAAIQQQFEAKKASYGKPELRSFIEIPLNDPKQVAGRRRGPDQRRRPALVAKSVGVDPVTYSDQPQSGVADLKAGVAAFAMKEGAGQRPGPGRLQDRGAEGDQGDPGRRRPISPRRAPRSRPTCASPRRSIRSMT